jgi:MrcB-like, N-terminal domain
LGRSITITPMTASPEMPGPDAGTQGDLSALLEAVLTEMRSPARSSERLRELVTVDGPALIRDATEGSRPVNAGVGIATPALVPWMSVHTPGATRSARAGYYVVYLFAEDGSAVYLSLNQGTDDVRGGIPPIKKRAVDIRAAAGLLGSDGLAIDLASDGDRPKKYEAGNAYAIRYQAGQVPSAHRVLADLATVLGHLDAAHESGLEFDPEVEPTHLVSKWSASLEKDTVSLHQAVADEKDSVWWGRFGHRAHPIQPSRLKALRDQIERGIPTYAFLHGGKKAVRTRLLEITVDQEDVDEARLPGYYEKADCDLFTRLAEFESLDDDWLANHVVQAKGGGTAEVPPALENTTTPLYVYELFDRTHPPQPGLAVNPPDMDWLVAQTLWTQPELEELLDAIRDRGQVILAGPPGTGRRGSPSGSRNI